MLSVDSAKVLLLAGPFSLRGTSVYTLRLAEKLRSDGFDVRVISPDATRVPEDVRRRLGIESHAHLNTPLWGKVVVRSLAAELRDDPPDLIHVQSREILARGTTLSTILDRPLVLTVHDYMSTGERLRFDVSHKNRIIAVSQSVKTELLDRTGLSDDVVTVIHSGVDANDDVECIPILTSDHVPVVGMAGPLEAVKGIPFFLGAAQKVLSVNSNVQFLVSGAGPEEANLRRLARDLGISQSVTFAPNLLDYSTALSAMDIFCLPSLRQGLGTIMLEAMALGRPVIATGVGGVYSAVRDDETGLVVPPSDSRRLAERILELLNDPDRARTLAEAGRRLVLEEFSVDKMVHQTAELYREVLELQAVATA